MPMNRAQRRRLHGTRRTSVRETIIAKAQYLWGGDWDTRLSRWIRREYGFSGLNGATKAQQIDIDRALAERITEVNKIRDRRLDTSPKGNQNAG